jgi:hypothetical protein
MLQQRRQYTLKSLDKTNYDTQNTNLNTTHLKTWPAIENKNNSIIKDNNKTRPNREANKQRKQPWNQSFNRFLQDNIRNNQQKLHKTNNSNPNKAKKNILKLLRTQAGRRKQRKTV